MPKFNISFALGSVSCEQSMAWLFCYEVRGKQALGSNPGVLESPKQLLGDDDALNLGGALPNLQ